MKYYEDFDVNDLDILMGLLQTIGKLSVIKSYDWDFEFEDTLEPGCRCGGCHTSTTIGYSIYINDNNYEISSV